MHLQHTSLSPAALDMIHAYETLPFGNAHVLCPYLNNKRQQVRGALRVLVGKGTPQEIREEADLMAMREHRSLAALSQEDIRTFLVDHQLGVDCSGFAYHVLHAECIARTGKPLARFLSFPFARSPFRKLLTRLRPAENTNVKVLAHDANSMPISLRDLRAGDIITMIGSKKVGNPDHILIVAKTEGTKVHYAHSYKVPSDGKYGHGIKRGSITIRDIEKTMGDQTWDNEEVLAAVLDAEQVSLRRLTAFEKHD